MEIPIQWSMKLEVVDQRCGVCNNYATQDSLQYIPCVNATDDLDNVDDGLKTVDIEKSFWQFHVPTVLKYAVWMYHIFVSTTSLVDPSRIRSAAAHAQAVGGAGRVLTIGCQTTGECCGFQFPTSTYQTI